MQGILNGENMPLSRVDITALVKWGVYQESKAHEEVCKNLHHGAPANLEEALIMLGTLETKISSLEDEIEDLQSMPTAD